MTIKFQVITKSYTVSVEKIVGEVMNKKTILQKFSNIEEKILGQYKYIECEKLPMLILGIKISLGFENMVYPHYKYNFKKFKHYNFIKIAHQTAGHGCHHHYYIATILKPKLETYQAMNRISKHWLNSCCGMGGYPLLDELNKYRKQLQTLLNVDCNFEYADFEEGIYPIDCTYENVKKLAVCPALPENFDDFIEWKNAAEKLAGCLSRWNLCILGDNCD